MKLRKKKNLQSKNRTAYLGNKDVGRETMWKHVPSLSFETRDVLTRAVVATACPLSHDVNRILCWLRT